MGLINEEIKIEIADATITVVERQKGEMTDAWKFINLRLDNMQRLTPAELRKLGKFLVRESHRIGRLYKSNGAKRQ